MTDNDFKIDEDGVVEVQIAPIGQFNGSDAKGNAIPETLTQENLTALADKLNASGEEVLTDIDHASCRPGLDRDTAAVGWLSRFWTNVKGLFGKMRLTKRGRELVEGREYRFLSPTFSLDEKGHPVDLHSVAFTNTPAFQGAIRPIVNHQAVETTNTEIQSKEGILNMNITKEELVELIKTTVTAMNSHPVKNECGKTEEEVENTEVETPTTETGEPVESDKSENPASTQNACSDKTEEDGEQVAKNEESDKSETPTSEAPTEEKPSKNEEDDTDDKEDDEEESDKSEESETSSEVIKLAALNSTPAPKAPQDAEWKFLHGAAFWTALREHPEWLERN